MTLSDQRKHCLGKKVKKLSPLFGSISKSTNFNVSLIYGWSVIHWHVHVMIATATWPHLLVLRCRVAVARSSPKELVFYDSFKPCPAYGDQVQVRKLACSCDHPLTNRLILFNLE